MCVYLYVYELKLVLECSACFSGVRLFRNDDFRRPKIDRPITFKMLKMEFKFELHDKQRKCDPFLPICLSKS